MNWLSGLVFLSTLWAERSLLAESSHGPNSEPPLPHVSNSFHRLPLERNATNRRVPTKLAQPANFAKESARIATAMDKTLDDELVRHFPDFTGEDDKFTQLNPVPANQWPIAHAAVMYPVLLGSRMFMRPQEVEKKEGTATATLTIPLQKRPSVPSTTYGPYTVGPPDGGTSVTATMLSGAEAVSQPTTPKKITNTVGPPIQWLHTDDNVNRDLKNSEGKVPVENFGGNDNSFRDGPSSTVRRVAKSTIRRVKGGTDREATENTSEDRKSLRNVTNDDHIIRGAEGKHVMQISSNSSSSTDTMHGLSRTKKEDVSKYYNHYRRNNSSPRNRIEAVQRMTPQDAAMVAGIEMLKWIQVLVAETPQGIEN